MYVPSQNSVSLIKTFIKDFGFHDLAATIILLSVKTQEVVVQMSYYLFLCTEVSGEKPEQHSDCFFLLFIQ
jgi:hypothetical protein